MKKLGNVLHKLYPIICARIASDPVFTDNIRFVLWDRRFEYLAETTERESDLRELDYSGRVRVWPATQWPRWFLRSRWRKV